MLPIVTTIIFLAFMIPISINMIMFIQSQRKNYSIQEEIQMNHINKGRTRRMVVLFILLPVVFFLIFFGNYLLRR